MQIVPWVHQVRESWKSLTPPLWNHFSGGGYPLLGNGQSSALSLLRFLALPLPLGRAVSAEAAMKVLIALTFTFLYCRGGYSLLGSIARRGHVRLRRLHHRLAALPDGHGGLPRAGGAVRDRPARGAADVRTLRLRGACSGRSSSSPAIRRPRRISSGWRAVYVLWLVLRARSRPWRLILTLGGALAVAALLAAPYLVPLLETMPKSKRVAELKDVPLLAEDLPYSDRNSRHRDVPAALLRAGAVGEAVGTGRHRAARRLRRACSAGWRGSRCALHVIAARQWRSREMFFAIADAVRPRRHLLLAGASASRST